MKVMWRWGSHLFYSHLLAIGALTEARQLCCTRIPSQIYHKPAQPTTFVWAWSILADVICSLSKESSNSVQNVQYVPLKWLGPWLHWIDQRFELDKGLTFATPFPNTLQSCKGLLPCSKKPQFYTLVCGLHSMFEISLFLFPFIVAVVSHPLGLYAL